jgi:type II secretory pathway component PulC
MKRFIFFFLYISSFLYPADYDIILSRNIFAPVKDKKEAEEASPRKEILPVIKLPAIDELFELRGTFFARRNPEESIAILENKKTGEMDFYRTGEVIESALINAIGDNRVLFIYGFREIELTNRGSRPVRIYPDGEYTVNLDEFMLEFSREAVEPFPAKAEPVVENGAVAGFRIKNLQEDSLLKKYGIKNNDIITKINTIALDSPEKPFFAYENIMKYAIREVSVRLYRDNLPYTLLYRLN